jgi:hypothetical protein
MLTQEVVTRITEYVAAEMAPREGSLGRALREAQSLFAKNGTLGSSMAIQSYARTGGDELAIRAGSIWRAIQRSHASMVGTADASTLADLKQLAAQHVNAQASTVAAICNERLGPAGNLRNPQFKDMITNGVQKRAAELLAGINIEIQFYLDSLRQRASATPAGPVYNFHGAIGSVQTGANAVANVQLSAGDRDQLIRALEDLMRAITSNGEIAETNRVQTVELVDDAYTALRAERPNPSKVAALLGGVGSTIQSVASLRGAMDLVRDTAQRIGLL